MSVQLREFVNEGARLWTLAASTALKVRGDEAAREPLQLLIGALVYHRKALKGFSDLTLHETVRQDPALVIGLFSRDAATLTAALPAIGGMHLASAALRIPTAVLEVIDARPTSEAPFTTLLSKDAACHPYDWKRGECSDLFNDLSLLDHCAGRPLTYSESLVLLLLFREDFGHGEEGRGTGSVKREYWIKNRQERLDSTHRCRAFEAQRCLIEWGLNALAGP